MTIITFAFIYFFIGNYCLILCLKKNMYSFKQLKINNSKIL